jgi:hypothetical protein
MYCLLTSRLGRLTLPALGRGRRLLLVSLPSSGPTWKREDASGSAQLYPSSQAPRQGSQLHGQRYPSGHGHSTPRGPFKFIKKVLGTNIPTKSSPHLRGNANLAKHSSSAVSPTSSVTHPQEITPHTQPSKGHAMPMGNVHEDDGPVPQSHTSQQLLPTACPHLRTTSRSTAYYARISSDPTTLLESLRRLMSRIFIGSRCS